MEVELWSLSPLSWFLLICLIFAGVQTMFIFSAFLSSCLAKIVSLFKR